MVYSHQKSLFRDMGMPRVQGTQQSQCEASRTNKAQRSLRGVTIMLSRA